MRQHQLTRQQRLGVVLERASALARTSLGRFARGLVAAAAFLISSDVIALLLLGGGIASITTGVQMLAGTAWACIAGGILASALGATILRGLAK